MRTFGLTPVCVGPMLQHSFKAAGQMLKKDAPVTVSLAFTGICSRVRAAVVGGRSHHGFLVFGSGVSKQFISVEALYLGANDPTKTPSFTGKQIKLLLCRAEARHARIEQMTSNPLISKVPSNYEGMRKQLAKQRDQAANIEAAAQFAGNNDKRISDLAEACLKAAKLIPGMRGPLLPKYVSSEALERRDSADSSDSWGSGALVVERENYFSSAALGRRNSVDSNDSSTWPDGGESDSQGDSDDERSSPPIWIPPPPPKSRDSSKAATSVSSDGAGHAQSDVPDLGSNEVEVGPTSSDGPDEFDPSRYPGLWRKGEGGELLFYPGARIPITIPVPLQEDLIAGETAINKLGQTAGVELFGAVSSAADTNKASKTAIEGA
ncbi:hypothetical protein PS865_04420 [Pseudomonas fluorescens]|uniref:hypothetical protein n=1 Tax=Pseudomonas fluorescens TaxID=294 RepID=UPI00125AE5FA|nr:hypothetical protein [Pseudomonas fluorescens]VVP32204.1 hypothetical protein PS865_04420 [Pseudomonas fluorescens]